MSELFPDYRSPWENDDQQVLRKHAAEFFHKECTPHQERWAAQHQVDRDFWNKAGAAGLLCLDLPEEFGGGGGNFGHEAVVQQELTFAHDSAFGFGVHSTIAAHYISAFGTDEQRARWLPKLVTGELVLAIAMTEPGTGSDLQSVRTTAIRNGDDYVINGSKTFISNGSHCDLLIIVAKTDAPWERRASRCSSPKPKACPASNAVASCRRSVSTDRTPANCSSPTCVFPSATSSVRSRARLLPVDAATPTGTAEHRHHRRRHGRSRRHRGHPLRQGPLRVRQVGPRLPEHQIRAGRMQDGGPGRQDTDRPLHPTGIDGTLDAATASMAKLWGSEKQCEIVDRCLQIFGGYGYMMEYPIAQMYTAARVQKIYGGTNEVMKDLIARTL